jgi:hypothetical protein
MLNRRAKTGRLTASGGLALFFCLITGFSTPVFVIFGQDAATRQLKYSEFLVTFNREEESFSGNLEFPVGDKEFKQRLIKRHGRYFAQRNGQPRKY